MNTERQVTIRNADRSDRQPGCSSLILQQGRDPMTDALALAEPLCALLDKPRCDFTREDLLRVIKERKLEWFTFHYAGGDGQLKELRLPFGDRGEAERILATGERVDGSSLFRGAIDVSASDLYVVPVYSTAFLSPFDPSSLDLLCRFLDRDGQLAEITPDNVLKAAHQRFQGATGLELHALGELEFFLLSERDNGFYAPQKQGGYHSSAPFSKTSHVVNEMAGHIARITGAVKYAHAEVGYIEAVHSDDPRLAGRTAEQHEIELLSRPVEEMGDVLAVAKWVIRNVAYRHGMLATFAPKLDEGVAGNGMHVHLELRDRGRNVMVDRQGALSEKALRLIGGLVHHASSLSAFGNTVPPSYLRLVANHEAPTRIVWSDVDRSALIRVPLGWRQGQDLSAVVNPMQPNRYHDAEPRQTVELRSPDGSAQCHLLLAGIACSAHWGLTSPDSLEMAAATRCGGDAFRDPSLLERVEPLPRSCVAAARVLAERRHLYEDDGVFPPALVTHTVERLLREDDEHLDHELAAMTDDARLRASRRIMHRGVDQY